LKKKIKKTLKKSTIDGLPLNYEQSYLAELINDFPCKTKVTVVTAEKILRARYLQLEKNIPKILQLIDIVKTSALSKNVINLARTNKMFPEFFISQMLFFHEYLFEDILSNAGKLRLSSDPNGGRVGFGGSDSRIIGNFKYIGSPCSEIENDLSKCFALLTENPPDPISSSVEFYRRFVKIHPFYDANGRIGRLIISLYNQRHGFYINWSQIEKDGNKSNFIKRLNECHKRENQKVYSIHFEYLLSFVKKYTIKISELTD